MLEEVELAANKSAKLFVQVLVAAMCFPADKVLEAFRVGSHPRLHLQP
jgi:hypothetical protein